MKKYNLTQFVAIIAIFGFSLSVYAQDTNERFPKIIYELGIGKGTLIGVQNLSPWGVDYRKNYSGGFYWQMQAIFVFRNNLSLGLKGDMFTTAGNYVISNNQRVIENIMIGYLAPQIGIVRPVSSRMSIIANIGIGYALYHSSGLLDNTEYLIRSNMLGFNMDFSMDYLLTKNLAMGYRASLFSAHSRNLHRDINGVKDKIELNNWDRISPNRFGFSVFLRRYF